MEGPWTPWSAFRLSRRSRARTRLALGRGRGGRRCGFGRCGRCRRGDRRGRLGRSARRRRRLGRLRRFRRGHRCWINFGLSDALLGVENRAVAKQRCPEQDENAHNDDSCLGWHIHIYTPVTSMTSKQALTYACDRTPCHSTKNTARPHQNYGPKISSEGSSRRTCSNRPARSETAPFCRRGRISAPPPSDGRPAGWPPATPAAKRRRPN